MTDFRPASIPFAALLLAACAQTPTTPVPAPLVPAGETPVARVAARGVQVYECRAGKDGAAAWEFVAPDAELLDAGGAMVGRHYAGPHWEAPDGSKIVGSVKARAEAPRAGAIPWLLLTTRSDGDEGRWSRVSSVQRIDTAGGTAPAGGCDAAALGRSARVPYTATYVLFVPR